MFVSLTGDAKISGNETEDFQVRNTNRLHAAVACGTKPVRGGAWYFETRCVNGSAVVGWAVAGFKKNITSGNAGEVFYIDFSKNVIFGGSSRQRISRVQVNTGDIIGSMIDFNTRCISFSYNGEFIPDLCIRDPAFSGGGYCPVVELRAGCSACVSVSASSFIAAVPRDARPYGTSTAEAAAGAPTDKTLNEIFDKYATEKNPNKIDEDELLELFKGVGEESDSDPIAFVFLWFVNRDTHGWDVTRDKFVTAFSNARCKSLDDIKKLLRKECNNMLTHRGESWPVFYKFVFHLLPETGSHKVNAEKAAGVWEVLGFNKWKFFNQWVEFITEQQHIWEEEVKETVAKGSVSAAASKRTDPALIGLDVWQLFPQFVAEYGTSLDAYDLDDLSYNSLFSDFVEKIRSR